MGAARHGAGAARGRGGDGGSCLDNVGEDEGAVEQLGRGHHADELLPAVTEPRPEAKHEEALTRRVCACARRVSPRRREVLLADAREGVGRRAARAANSVGVQLFCPPARLCAAGLDEHVREEEPRLQRQVHEPQIQVRVGRRAPGGNAEGPAQHPCTLVRALPAVV